MSYRIDPDQELPEELRRITVDQIERALADFANTTLPQHERVHQARKRFKKIRSLMRLAREPLGEVRVRENEFFRELGRDLSDVRDAQVAVDTYDELMERYLGALDSKGMRAIRRDLERRRREILRAAGLRSKISLIRKELKRAPTRIRKWPLEGAGFELLNEGLRNSYARGRRRMRRAEKQRTTPAVHEWRKRAKDLWYHMRLLEGLWPDVVGGYASALSDLSSILGLHHDHDVLRHALDRLESIDTVHREALEALCRTQEEDLLDQSLELGRMIYTDPVDVYIERMSTIWKVRVG